MTSKRHPVSRKTRRFPPRPCTSGIHAGQRRRGCGRAKFRLLPCQPSFLLYVWAHQVPVLFTVALTRHLSWEGGAGERVQGARAAYGTCFVCADRTRRPVIPGFFRLPKAYLNRHTQGAFGNKLALQAVPTDEWL